MGKRILEAGGGNGRCPCVVPFMIFLVIEMQQIMLTHASLFFQCPRKGFAQQRPPSEATWLSFVLSFL